MRPRKKKNADSRLSACQKVTLPDAADYKGRYCELFGNNKRDIHLEIGCGKGAFIARMAQMNPDVNFLALEKVKDVLVTAAERLAALNLPNVYLLPGDAADLGSYFAENELSRIYLNFSDPWPKSKNAKRRLTYPAFLSVYRGILKPGGAVFLKTDNRDFFEYSLHSFAQAGFSLRNVTYDLHGSGLERNIMTEYEEKFSSQGIPICRCEAYSHE